MCWAFCFGVAYLSRTEPTGASEMDGQVCVGSRRASRARTNQNRAVGNREIDAQAGEGSG
jgi:hypothetical protein